ncbi:MAG: DNA-directed RNA polymerase subunit omega [Candidatus Omnitrophica bacterium]|nr:DNA-directed RNA polymerase subunit omega [Candidatus Omnitrophota bacterium]MBU4589538.1 DNA-directed RNA polymerase subunit omega [Candidatus Omnitrophota bacterium]
MSYVPRESVFKNGDSIFKVTLLAARRAIELNDGAQKLIETTTKKFSTIALEEIGQGKVRYKIKDKKA